jgi:hypothetical protein
LNTTVEDRVEKNMTVSKTVQDRVEKNMTVSKTVQDRVERLMEQEHKPGAKVDGVLEVVGCAE